MFDNSQNSGEGDSNKMKTIYNKQRGAVSLFIVVFATLLITIISVGFVGIMVQDQQQASTADLSQSAYDSAQAGVEDAKRALLRFQSFCADGGDCSTGSTEYQKITSSTCNDSVSALKDIDASGDEVKIQTGGSNTLDQAYTCVKIRLNTVDYLGTLSANESKVIPLNGVGDFNTIQIEWFSSRDISSNTGSVVNLQSDGQTPLLQSWPVNRPSILQAQLIQFGNNGFSLSDLDSANNSDTLFLYPSTIGVSPISFLNDMHLVPTGKPQLVKCSSSLQINNYACSVQITLPVPVNGGSRTAFLRLGALFNNTSFRVVLLNNATTVEFNAVQPEVDSTGRTNDLFRRVLARVELTDTNFPYPEAAVDITGNFCKDFAVTDNVDDYAMANTITNGGNTINGCTP